VICQFVRSARKTPGNPEDILYMNAGEYVEKGTRKIICRKDINNIISIYRERKKAEIFSILLRLNL